MNEKNESAIEEQHTGVFRTIALIIGVLALLASLAAVLVVVKRKIADAMAKINKDTVFEPYEEEDLTAAERSDADGDAEED